MCQVRARGPFSPSMLAEAEQYYFGAYVSGAVIIIPFGAPYFDATCIV